MQLHFKIIGVLLILLSFIHIGFPRYFKWQDDCSNLSLINRQMMYIHTFFIGLVVFLTGVLCLCCSSDLTTTAFGKKIDFGLGIFWGFRLLIQFWGYSSELWKGKRFETIAHIVFSLLWVYLSVIFFAAAIL